MHNQVIEGCRILIARMTAWFTTCN